jgi:hypothetical protein
MIDKDVMISQNHTNSEMEIRDPCGEPNPTSRYASQATNIKIEKVSDAEEEVGHIKVEEVSDAEEEVGHIKVEEVSYAEEEAGPVPITFPKIKAEPEVRCMSLYVHCKK